VIARELLPRYVPITVWLPAFDRADLRGELIAGLASWGVMVPVALAYAGLAGMPPEAGLATAFAALVGYAIFGTSRELRVTTSSTMAIMSAAIVAPLAGVDPVRFVALTAALALTVGVLLIAAGIVRLGFVSEFLSQPVVTGFIAGLAITIVIGQLPKLFGVPPTSGTVPEQLLGFLSELGQTSVATLVMGLAAIGLIVLMRLVAPRIPGPLVVLVLGIVAMQAFDLETHGITVVGEIRAGLPVPGLPAIGLADLPFLVLGSVGIIFLAGGESIGSARAFAAQRHYEIDPDQELIALGAANVSSALFGGFAADASLAQSATAVSAGARSQASSLVTAALILATTIVLAPLFTSLPNTVLAAIVITSAVRLIDLPEFRRYRAWRTTDLVLSIVAMVGVLATTVLTGLMVAVLVSILLLLYRASRPYVAVLGRAPGEPMELGDVSRDPRRTAVPGLLVLRVDMPLYFFNVTVARTQVLELLGASEEPPSAIILDIAATADLDTPTVDMLRLLRQDVAARGSRLVLAAVRGPVRDRMRRTGLIDDFPDGSLYRTVEAAVAELGAGVPPASPLEQDRPEGGPEGATAP
jgi:SulP family sulfate permease